MKKLYTLLFTLLISTVVFAEDDPFKTKTNSDEFEKGFGEAKGITEAEKSDTEKDKMHIGGTVSSEFYYYNLEGSGEDDKEVFTNPNMLWLYMDSRLRNDIRAYVKGKLTYDPTLDETKTSPLTGEPNKKTMGSLEEMKLMFNIKKTVFMTVGKQKIKWGSARFWNPTDLVNTTKRDPLRAEDERSGVSLVKAHVPVGASNFYAIGMLDDADKTNHLGYASRIEIPFSSSEIAISTSGRKDQKSIYALDVSTAVFDFDVYGEGAYSKKDKDTDTIKTTAGVSYEHKYSDQDTVAFQAEYYSNNEGCAKISEYAGVLQNHLYSPFNLSKQYGMFMIYLPSPGSLNDWTFTLFNIANLSDDSYLTKLDTTLIAMQDLTTTFGVGYHYGEKAGELRLGGQKLDLSLLLRIVF